MKKMKVGGASPMVGGAGQYSYYRNSIFQKSLFVSIENKVHDTIFEKFDIPISGTIRIADLGCSVGPNTFYTMQKIVDAILLKHEELAGNEGKEPEVQVFFNDQVGNDFNQLFSSMPSNWPYMTAAVPGSFYSRLFPRASIHCFNSTLALHWISKAPDGVANKGRVHYYGGGPDVLNAYIAQFRSDAMGFLSVRAEELVTGGLLILQFCCRLESMAPDALGYDIWFCYLELILRQLVDEGKVNEADLDSFQVPIFGPSIEEFKEVVEMNGCFTIHVGEHVKEERRLNGGGDEGTEVDLQQLAHVVSNAARAALEKMVCDHFGSDIGEEVFERFPNTAYKHFITLPSMYPTSTTAFFVLQKKPLYFDQ